MFCSCSNEDIEIKARTSAVNQQNEVESAKTWFKNNPLKNNFRLLEFAEKIDWEKAQSLNNGNGIAVEVPIILRQHIFLTADNSTISVNRLLFIKTAKNEFTPYIINISSSKNDLELIKEITRINYFSIPNDFTGKVLIIKNNNKGVNLNVLVDGKEAIKKPNITYKEASVTCYEVVELFDTGPPRHTGIFFCLPDGGSDTTNYPYYGGSSHGTGTNAIVDPCDQIKIVMDYNPNDPNSLKANLNWLRDKVNATVNNKECGVEVKKMMNADESFKYEFTQVLSNEQFSVPLSTGSSYIGASHSHPSDGYAMFSFQDVRFLLDVYDGASSTRKGEVFNSVVCKDNSGNTNTYMLKIDNIDALRTQINAVWNGEKYAEFQDEESRIKAIHINQAELYAGSNGQLEKSFLEQFAAFGVLLYKADAELSTFNKLALINSTLTSTPCN